MKMMKKKTDIEKLGIKAIQFIVDLIIHGATIYYKVLHFFTRKDYFNRKHLEVIFEGLTIKVRWFNHDDYVQHKLDKLQIARQESDTTEEFLEYLLNECRSCNYVIFNGENENRFIQFWLGDGKLMVDFPILKKNGLKKYRYQMLGVLNELDIHAVKPGMKKPKRIPYYEHKQSSDFETYEIYFQDYPKEAVNFVKLMFDEVYKEKFDDLKYQLA